MPTTTDMAWFKGQFHANVATAVAGTPFDLSMITALASQETGNLWGPLSRRGTLTTQQILNLCVGDVITGPRRKAFPTSAAQLKARPSNGQAMYDQARQCLKDVVAAGVGGLAAYVDNPERFCHGFGILQADLQHYKTTPHYFLNREWADIDKAVARCVAELREQQAGISTLRGKTSLTDLEKAQVAIAYNTGGYKPAKGLKQGFQNDEGLFYGELFYSFLQKARTVPDPLGVEVTTPRPAPGQAPIAQPSPITATGPVYRVDTRVGRLMLRKTADSSSDANIDEKLPDGQLVRSFGEAPVNGFLRVETSVNGARKAGFVSTKFIVQQGPAVEVPVTFPAPAPPKKGAVAVYLPHKPTTIFRRSEPANAGSLNEPGQPGRTGSTPAKRVAELSAIIDWLDAEKPAHKRYRPAGGLTFCNIYAHDFCTLAGVYLPRVWWTGPALLDLARGVKVEPLYDKTIREIRANELLNWLDDFGPTFGWRRTSGLSVLQTEANQGAVGLVVARRVNSKGPGHIAVAVPETDTVRARRDATGEVTLPVLSQAGAKNVNRGRSTSDWWTGAQFETHAYWLHA